MFESSNTSYELKFKSEYIFQMEWILDNKVSN